MTLAPGQPASDARFLLACMPKSGSTYLSAVIANLPGMRRERLVPAYERREQEICAHRIADADRITDALRQAWRQKRLLGGRPRGYVAQHHVRLSAYTASLIERHDLLPIVLTRDIFDIVPSVHDHLTSSALFMSMAFVEENYKTLDVARAHDFIGDVVIPWYFNFFMSWHRFDNKIIVNYREIKDSPEETIERIYRHFGRPIQRMYIAEALEASKSVNTRRNKAVAGRGESLSDDLKAKIRRYAAYYPDVDFSPMGL